MSSFNHHIVVTLPKGVVHDGISKTLPSGKDFWFFFGYPITTLMFPSISISEVGLFTPGERGLGRVLAIDSTTGLPIKGSRNQTLIELDCWAKDTAAKSDAEKVVRELRDQVMYVLMNAGEFDVAIHELVVRPIELRDYSQNSPPLIGYIKIDRSPNSITERFIVDQVDQNIKRYRMLVRVFWDELV
jgi:hypothetical protein